MSFCVQLHYSKVYVCPFCFRFRNGYIFNCDDQLESVLSGVGVCLVACWKPLDVDKKWSNVKKGKPWHLVYCVGRDSCIENQFWMKLPWSCFYVMEESILIFPCWIFRFCPSPFSIVYEVNACVCFFHHLFYVVLIVLLLFLYCYIYCDLHRMLFLYYYFAA